MIHRFTLAVLIASISCAVSFGADDGDAIPTEKKTMLPKVPARSAIVKGNQAETTAVGEWSRAFIAAKEKKANAELEIYKKQVIEDERQRQVDERNRIRRQERSNDLFKNSPVSTNNTGKRGPIRIQLDFQVPEITTYRLASEVCRAQQRFANDVVEALSRMDRDNDGKLTNEEYKEASSLVIGSRIVNLKLDSNGDGMITEDEIEALRQLPESITGAIVSGREATSAFTFKLKNHDADSNGVLDVDERKKLVMQYVDSALRAGQEADFYRTAADSLSSSRAVVAEKFANIEVAP